MPRYYYSAFDHAISPSWTPDGKRIVFVRFDVARERWAIFTVRSNGHDLRQITPWELDRYFESA